MTWARCERAKVFPTLARLVGAELPPHPIDGRDVWPLISGQKGARNPHEAYFYYFQDNQLQAVTSGDGRWKLYLPHSYRTLAGRPGGQNGISAKYEQAKLSGLELYDLKRDIPERTNVAARHPEIVERLLVSAETARAELGDTLTGRQGRGVRPPGRVTEPN